MALRVTTASNFITGTNFNGGLGAGVRGLTTFAWMRRPTGTEAPRFGVGVSSTIKFNVGLNGNTPRFIAQFSGSYAITTTHSAGSRWMAVAGCAVDVGGTRRTQCASGSDDPALTPLLGTATTQTGLLGNFMTNPGVAIGREPGVATAFPGDYAHCAVWDVGLDDNDLLALVGGANPLTVRRANLIAYWPLNGSLRNLANPAYELPPNTDNPVWVDDPRTVLPAPAASRTYLLLSTGGTPSEATLSGTGAEARDTSSGAVSVRATLGGSVSPAADQGTGAIAVRASLTGTAGGQPDAGAGAVAARATLAGSAVEQRDAGAGLLGTGAVLTGTAPARSDAGAGALTARVGVTGSAPARQDSGTGDLSVRVAVSGATGGASDAGAGLARVLVALIGARTTAPDAGGGLLTVQTGRPPANARGQPRPPADGGAGPRRGLPIPRST